MINRKLAPAFKQVEHIELIKAQPLTFKNGLKTFVIDGGGQDLLKLEFIISNVNWDPRLPIQASATNAMLNEGTGRFTAAQIAEQIDFYGAFLQTESNYDSSSLVVYTLTKYLSAVLPIVKSMLSDSVFPEKELETYKRNQLQKLSVMLEKNDVVGRRVFSKALFGDTLYGHPTETADYESLKRDDLLEYFKSAYNPQNCTLIISGKVESKSISLLEDFFGADWSARQEIIRNEFTFSKGPGATHYIERADAIQSAIRIGSVSVNRSHPDFPALQVLNTALGGYFGSRLMANIREDKGYTYGIGSALVSLENAGYFFIASEVGTDVCNSAVNEIEKELNSLKTELIPAAELQLVQNYMLGSMLGSLENAFSHADKFKNIYFFGLGYDYYDQYIDTIKNITAPKLMELANQYLNFNDFEKVIVGKK